MKVNSNSEMAYVYFVQMPPRKDMNLIFLTFAQYFDHVNNMLDA